MQSLSKCRGIVCLSSEKDDGEGHGSYRAEGFWRCPGVEGKQWAQEDSLEKTARVWCWGSWRCWERLARGAEGIWQIRLWGVIPGVRLSQWLSRFDPTSSPPHVTQAHVLASPATRFLSVRRGQGDHLLHSP